VIRYPTVVSEWVECIKELGQTVMLFLYIKVLLLFCTIRFRKIGMNTLGFMYFTLFHFEGCYNSYYSTLAFSKFVDCVYFYSLNLRLVHNLDVC